jgi:glycosyltransferase involved in cell wall biosynthesis
VINNAVKIDDAIDATDWKEKYPQIHGKRLIISVGSLSPGKNQMQLLRAFNLLPEEVKSNTMVFFAGQDLTGGEVANYVESHHLQDNVVICGFLTKKELAGLYHIVAFNVLLSIAEGFGLSMIEAAKYGIPTLTFSDLDAITDLSPESMLLINERTDEAVAEGLLKLFNLKWDKERIIKSVNRFNEDIYYQYLDVYRRILDNKTNLIKPEVVLKAIGL